MRVGDWMRSVIVAAVAVVLAFVASVPPSPREAQAEPTDVVVLNSGVCLTLGILYGGLGPVEAANSCGSFEIQPSVQSYIYCLRAEDQARDLDPLDPNDAILIDVGYPDPIPADGVQSCGEGVTLDDPLNGLLRPTPEDFAIVDRDANQIHVGQPLFMIAFVDGEGPVQFTTPAGVFVTPSGQFTDYTCDTELEDPDCDGNASTIGDGVVVARLQVGVATPRGAHGGTIMHGGESTPFSFTVVGPPSEISLSVLMDKPSILSGGSPPTPGPMINPNDPLVGDDVWDTIPGPPPNGDGCDAPLDNTEVDEAHLHTRKMVVIAKALDDQGTEVVGALIEWDKAWGGYTDFVWFSSESDIANVATPQTPTIDTGDFGIGFAQVVCSSGQPGTETLNVRFSPLISPASNVNATGAILVNVVDPPPGSGAWSSVPLANIARQGHTSTLLPNGRVLVSGGSLLGTSHTEIYSPLTDSWAPAAPAPRVRSNHTATLLKDGRVLYTGGDAGGAPYVEADLYNTFSNAWTPAAAMNVGRTEHTATLLPDGRVLVVGRDTTPEVYDPATNTWTPTPPIVHVRGDHAAVLLQDGRVLVAGGADAVGTTFDTAAIYDPIANAWTPAASMPGPRAGAVASLLPDGRVLLAGGSSATSVAASGAVVYDPTLDAWNPTGAMVHDRAAGHAGALLGDGRYLVAGGVGATSEVYDAATDAWTDAGSMVVVRGFLTLGPLHDARALAVGGGTSAAEQHESADPADLVDTDADGYNDGLELALGQYPWSYCDAMEADTNMDGRVNSIDLLKVAQQFGVLPAPPRLDYNGDGKISSIDLGQVAQRFGKEVLECP